MDQYSEMMGSSRASFLLLLCRSPLLILSFIHVLSSHFLNFIYTCPFCFHIFSFLSLLLPFLFRLPRHLPRHLVCSMHSPSLSGKILWKSSRRLTGWKQQEMRVQKQRGSPYSWNGAALSARGGKEVKRERMCMFKIQPEWDHSSSTSP